MKDRHKLQFISDCQLNNCSNVDSVAKILPKLNGIANISVREIDFAKHNRTQQLINIFACNFYDQCMI